MKMSLQVNRTLLGKSFGLYFAQKLERDDGLWDWANSNVYFSFSDENEQTDEQVVDEETAQEKRLRLAKQYLAQLEKEGILEKRYWDWLTLIMKLLSRAICSTVLLELSRKGWIFHVGF